MKAWCRVRPPPPYRDAVQIGWLVDANPGRCQYVDLSTTVDGLLFCIHELTGGCAVLAPGPVVRLQKGILDRWGSCCACQGRSSTFLVSHTSFGFQCDLSPFCSLLVFFVVFLCILPFPTSFCLLLAKLLVFSPFLYICFETISY